MGDTNNNRYLKCIYDLYDIVKFDKDCVIEEPKKKSIFHKKEKPTTKLKELLLRIDRVKKNLLETVPDFYNLWEFCEFVRVLEKVFFFDNSPKNNLYVEFDLSGKSKETKFRIREEGYEIRFTLTKSDSLFPAVNNKLEINVVRDFGLKMKNNYIVINENTKYEDTSDLYLINEINFKLKRIIHDTFSHAVELIIKDILQESEESKDLYEQYGFY